MPGCRRNLNSGWVERRKKQKHTKQKKKKRRQKPASQRYADTIPRAEYDDIDRSLVKRYGIKTKKCGKGNQATQLTGGRHSAIQI